MLKASILVIDDEEVIRTLLLDIFREQGYEVMCLDNGEDGFQEAMKKDYDVIIVDINLPGDDGIKIVDHIKKNDNDAVVIVITGCNSVHNIQEAMRVGAFDYLPKPFDVQQIVFSVKRAIASRNLIKTNKRLIKELAEQNSVLEKNVEERTERLAATYEHIQDVYLHMMTTLVTVIEAKDPYTRSHSENVAKYSVVIAKAMGLSPAQIELINKAARLHDIGKIGILDSILNKPDRLTQEEFEEVKRHPQKGEEILKPLDFLTVAIDLIKQHHERFDGKGYPVGLAGEQIHLGARIMSVADAYDAILSGRPYRKKTFTKEEAIDEIVRNSGTQFDPKVVEVFLKITNEL